MINNGSIVVLWCLMFLFKFEQYYVHFAALRQFSAEQYLSALLTQAPSAPSSSRFIEKHPHGSSAHVAGHAFQHFPENGERICCD
jgi:hypothetical protein